MTLLPQIAALINRARLTAAGLLTRGGETIADYSRPQEAGFANNPTPPCTVLTIRPDGTAGRPVIIRTARSGDAPTLQQGDVAIYAEGGAAVIVRAAGGIEIDGDLTVTGSITASGDITDGGGIVLGTHRHGGVDTGGGVSGEPQ